jgi:hypothetical protein
MPACSCVTGPASENPDGPLDGPSPGPNAGPVSAEVRARIHGDIDRTGSRRGASRRLQGPGERPHPRETAGSLPRQRQVGSLGGEEADAGHQGVLGLASVCALPVS